VSDGLLAVGVVVLGAVLTVAGTLLLRRRRLAVRTIPAFRTMPTAVDEAIESDRGLHISWGDAGVGGQSTLTALAGAQVVHALTERAAIGDRSPTVTMSDPLGLALAQDTLRRAYAARGLPNRFRATSAAWLPSGPGSLAFAAGAASLASDDNVSANVLIGRFGIEMIVIAEMGARRDIIQVAGSDTRLEGQAVAYVISETPMLGEEMFAGGAYLSRDPVSLGGLLAQDVLRWLMILFILLGFILATLTAGAT